MATPPGQFLALKAKRRFRKIIFNRYTVHSPRPANLQLSQMALSIFRGQRSRVSFINGSEIKPTINVLHENYTKYFYTFWFHNIWPTRITDKQDPVHLALLAFAGT